jgi:hypothetical protein
MPSLARVNNINLIALPALQQLSFTHGVTEAGNVTISNTQLNTLDGINPETADIFDVNNNPYLTNIDMQTANITQTLNIQANSYDLTASFPNLEFAFNMTFRSCSEINLPSLVAVNGSLGFYSNYFQNFSAANFTTTGQSLIFDDNPTLTTLSLPNLTQINGGYQIANNTELKTLAFPELKVIAGALDFSGNFTSVALPSLSDVRGEFNMQSSGNLDCTAFKNDKGSGVIKGTFICAGEQGTPGTASSTPSSSPSSPSPPPPSSSGDLSGGAKGGIAAGAIGGVILVALGIYLIFRSRRSRAKSPESPNDVDPGLPELPQGGHHEKAELSGGQIPAELKEEREHPVLEAEPSSHKNELGSRISNIAELSQGQHYDLPELEATSRSPAPVASNATREDTSKARPRRSSF